MKHLFTGNKEGSVLWLFRLLPTTTFKNGIEELQGRTLQKDLFLPLTKYRS